MDSKDKAKRRGWKWWVGLAAVTVVLGALVAVLGMRYYPQWQQKRLVARAKTYLSWKDYTSAALTVRRVLQQDDRNVDAIRLMAEIADSAGSSAALSWRRRIVEVEPQRIENHLELASAALAFGKTSLAKEALNSTPLAGRTQARYHELAGRVALASNGKAEAEAAFAEALKLEPGNPEYALNLAALRIESPLAEIRDAARKVAEGLVADPNLFRKSTQLLIDDALRRMDKERALTLADTLRSDPRASFEDRLAYLSLLHRLHREKFPGYLTELQEEAATEKNKLYTLISWLNTNGCALIALEWSKRLPSAILSEMPMPVAVAQSYVALGDWSGLKPIVAHETEPEQNADGKGAGQTTSAGAAAAAGVRWEGYEFMRLALLARSLRGAGQAQESTVAWNEAVQAVTGRPEPLQVLARAALDWNWENESTTVLWSLADGGVDGAQWALDVLSRRYLAAGSTRNLLRVVTRMYELDPTNVWAQNNVAALSLLLNANMDQALKLAGELHAKEPANPGYASTYAFGLHLHGRSEEGLAIMRALGDTKLQEPSYAAYYGVILAAIGSPEAAKYLDLAKSAPLLPEERKLVEDAKTRKGSTSGRPSPTAN